VIVKEPAAAVGLYQTVSVPFDEAAVSELNVNVGSTGLVRSTLAVPLIGE